MSVKKYILNYLVLYEGTKSTCLLVEYDLNTVKLGYNELGYNEHSVITNKLK